MRCLRSISNKTRRLERQSRGSLEIGLSYLIPDVEVFGHRITTLFPCAVVWHLDDIVQGVEVDTVEYSHVDDIGPNQEGSLNKNNADPVRGSNEEERGLTRDFYPKERQALCSIQRLCRPTGCYKDGFRQVRWQFRPSRQFRVQVRRGVTRLHVMDLNCYSS